jgi:hypothetical protein
MIVTALAIAVTLTSAQDGTRRARPDSRPESALTIRAFLDGVARDFAATRPESRPESRLTQSAVAAAAAAAFFFRTQLVLPQSPADAETKRAIVTTVRGRRNGQALIDPQKWFFTTEAARLDIAAWPAWSDEIRTASLSRQRVGGCSDGSWDPQTCAWPQDGGRMFCTTAMTLVLIQSYRGPLHRR